MAYIVNGEVVQKRSPWRIDSIPRFFWAIINTIFFFLQTLFSPEANNSYGKKDGNNRRGPGGSGGGSGGGGRPGGGGGGGGGGPRPRIAGMDRIRQANTSQLLA
eukprot:jgi/Chlat1/5081/Chrsp33S05067